MEPLVKEVRFFHKKKQTSLAVPNLIQDAPGMGVYKLNFLSYNIEKEA